ncbi:hypothetical protein [Chryseobacterium sp. Leaf201]|uniref:hypothetical protein n=1 Tax=Chryseobacterium sp. Leaf201 TaxID=1735672 RepID=UPI0006F40CEF|nr:hypothetical protein [Chryseobacterium sp. Leaf201]KQM41726.1 hypothetical protein ASE55_03695 [Chryseobacterium sp. Leaf201]
MKSTVTYAAWCNLFERFGNGDDTALDEMNTGSFDLDAGTAQRFYNQAEESYKTRKKRWLETFQRSFEAHHIKTTQDFEAVILTGRKNLIPFLKFSESEGLPEDLKDLFRKDLNEFTDEIRKSLKKSLPGTGKDREKIILIINSFRVSENSSKKSIQHGLNPDEAEPSTKRKIIF